jgi:hypothetical protein
MDQGGRLTTETPAVAACRVPHTRRCSLCGVVTATLNRVPLQRRLPARPLSFFGHQNKLSAIRCQQSKSKPKYIDPSTRVSRPGENGRGPPSLGMTSSIRALDAGLKRQA